MNESDTRDRRGAHRMQRGPLQAVLPGLLALAAVAALVVAVLVMRGTAPSTTVAAGATSSPQPSTTSAATASATAGPSGSATPGAATTPADGASPTPADTSTGGTSTGDTSTGGTEALKSSTSVVVLNQTRISGLAGQVAQTLRGAGWTVSGTGNFSGNVPATTVYYPEGMQAAAEALAADVPGPDRVRPRFGNLSKDKLTVIVTSAVG